jgi:Uma2 family endonuclease
MEQVAQTIILRNISWETYQRLLKERGRDTQPRYNYHLGRLEISVPSSEREWIKQSIDALVSAVAAGLGRRVEACERVTFQAEDLDSGFEPDACFYIENAGVIRARKKVDLTEDPVPDLAIEIDLGAPSLRKLPIFATLGVSEVWRYSADGLTIHKLAGDDYHELPSSEVLPGTARVTLTQLITDRRQMDYNDWLVKARDFVRMTKL